MMKKTKKVLILLLVIISLTGCTKYVKKDKKTVVYEKTGQTLTSNILCKPTDKDIISLYEENNVEIDKLPVCKTYKYSDTGYSGLGDAIFVRPLALIIIWVGNIVGNYGISVMLICLLIRIALAPLSAKNIKQSAAIKEAQKDLSRLEIKYKDKTDRDSMMAKSQETMIVYKKYGINPISGCLMSFIQLPLFFAFLEAINRVPAIFEEKLFTFQLGTTPWIGITKGNYLYIVLIVLIILSTYLSFKNSLAQTGGNSEQEKQTKFMLIFMLVFISIASFSLSTAIGLYWVVTNLFAVVQTQLSRKKLNK